MSIHDASRDDISAPDHPLMREIDRLAHLLPAQGPISIFIHHNTLHAFEHLPFEEAVEHAADTLGREPFLPESRYREKLASGRILARDVDALLREQLGGEGADPVAGVGRFDLWRAVVLHGIPAATGPELSWILDETDVLSRFRTDVPAAARLATTGELDDRLGEKRAVSRLWEACLAAVRRTGQPPPVRIRMPVRHRDWLTAFDIDTDAWIHPPLIRFLAGYLDQGLAHWPMPERNRGIHGCFLALYRTRLAAQCGRWAETLPGIVAEDHAAGRSALDSIVHSLERLGVGTAQWDDFLRDELLAQRGWAGIIRQIEQGRRIHVSNLAFADQSRGPGPDWGGRILGGGAKRVVQHDLNRRPLNIAKTSCTLNGFPIHPADFIPMDFFSLVARLKQTGESFDCLILDAPFFSTTSKGRVDQVNESARLINKVRPLVRDGGILIAVNNALYMSGKEYMTVLEDLCLDGYLKIRELIPVPQDFVGYHPVGQPITDPYPFNHSTKIAILDVGRIS